MRKLLPLVLLALAGCNAPPMNDAQRAAYYQSLQNMQAIQAQQAAQPIYQPVQSQPLQFQNAPIQGPRTTNCRRVGNEVNCTSY